MIGVRKRMLFPYYLVVDIYWRFIPLNCRNCYELRNCRSGFKSGRKCYHGCVKMNRLKEQEREDYLDKLVEYTDTQKGRL